MNKDPSQSSALLLDDVYKSIFDQSGQLNGAKYTETFLNIIFNDGVVYAEKFIAQVKNDKNVSKIASNVRVSENQLRDLKRSLHVSKVAKDFLSLRLNEYHPESTSILSNWSDLSRLVAGQSGVVGKRGFRQSTFERDLGGGANVKQLDKGRFSKGLVEHQEQRIDVLSNVRFSAVDSHFYSVVVEERFFNRKLCSRLAKLTNQVLLNKNETATIDEAIILPIAHTDRDYFQHLSEMWSGLALIDYFPKNLPIVYTEDTYGILDLLCERLGVDRSRFKSFSDMQSIRVNKAYQIHPVGGNLWDAAFFEHFNKYNSYDDSGFKVFLANPKGGVEIKNKEEVCKVLRDLGFLIVHPEDLPVSKLIDLFQRSSVLVTATSKVLANVAFMQRGSSLVELQDVKSIKADYYLRTRFNDMNYDCVLVNSGVVDVDELLTVLASRSV